MYTIKNTLLLLIAAGLWGSFFSDACCAAGEKIGVLVLGAGMDETYKPDWIPGYTGHFYPAFTPGHADRRPF